MMGPRQNREAKLFYTGVNLEERLHADHPLRKIVGTVNFAFVRSEVAAFYGVRGNPSLDPTLVLKMIFLLFYENVASERELLRQLPCRLDWLWFLELDLDSPIPDHSVLSKARRRWGPQIFASFFQRILTPCLGAGLVDGRKVHVDGSLITANADTGKLTLALRLAGETLYGQLDTPELPVTPPAEPSAEPRLALVESTPAEASPPASKSASPSAPVAVPPLGTLYCPTDPEARLTRKYGRTVLGYKDHRVVDDRCGIITATLTTSAAVDEGAMLATVLEAHERNTGVIPTAPTADKAYGTVANYCLLQECHCTPCIPHKAVREDPTKFRRALFIYDPQADVYHCPAGEILHRRGAPSENCFRYQTAKGVCQSCPLREQCTASRHGRTHSRQVRQDAIDWADTCLRPTQRRARMRRRKIRAEGSFADAANHHGYKRARWRGRERVRVQNVLIATIQNVRKLVRYGPARPARPASRLAQSAIALRSCRVAHISLLSRCRRPQHPNLAGRDIAARKIAPKLVPGRSTRRRTNQHYES